MRSNFWLAAVAVVVGTAIISGGTAYYAVQAIAPGASSAKADEDKGQSDVVVPVRLENQSWSFVIRPFPPSGSTQGSVVVFLAKTAGDVNVSAYNGTIPVEIAGVLWDAQTLSPPANATIQLLMNAAFTQSPPVALARAALSRHQSATEMVVVPDLNIKTIVVNAPATGDFVALHWPTGNPYKWSNETRAWQAITGQLPTLPAR